VVVTTTVILILKVFDVVRVMTSGEFATNVVANEMIAQLQFGNFHQGSALAVILFIAVIPILVYNVRQFRREGGL
jgi:alpha-glucoside transport system permease protein